jgi:hypothetical protein
MESVIRKIIVGPDPKNGMAYVVGMRMTSGTIDSIVLDEHALMTKGERRYIVYTETANGIEAWKSIENMPCMVEYDQNF